MHQTEITASFFDPKFNIHPERPDVTPLTYISTFFMHEDIQRTF